MTAGVEQLRAALERNAASVIGPVDGSQLIETVVARVGELAMDRPVAVPARDPVLDRFALVEELARAGFDLISPDHPDWRVAIERTAVGLTGAVAGAADPGTVAVACGPGAPRAVSLAPDAHVCILPVEVLEPDFNAALSRVLAAGLPPNLVWISGPSRSADIEKRITLGVHGPRTFELVLAGAT